MHRFKAASETDCELSFCRCGPSGKSDPDRECIDIRFVTLTELTRKLTDVLRCGMQTELASAQESTAKMNTCSLNHVGFAVTSIRQVAPDFARCVSATWDGEIIYDPLQLTNSSFLRARATGQPAIELVEPTAQGSPLYRFVEQGGGLHHLCYEVESLEQQLRLSRSLGALILKPPVPAVAFRGRRIAWVYNRTDTPAGIP